jgi:phenylalanyl-tRNA synthetase beta chain
MKIPISWLKDFVDIRIPVDELADKLTMAGLEVGSVDRVGGWDKCLVGCVRSVTPHPNADRLRLCEVDTGSTIHQVICGAPNVTAGQKICFAEIGASLFDPRNSKPMTLKAAKIRGEISEGMICSELELGLSDEHEGILVLPEDAPTGMPLDDYLGDYILDIEPTPNRADWFSILGVAYEIAALTGEEIHEPSVEYPEEGEDIHNQVKVTIETADLCPRYSASLIKGVSIHESPGWLQDRLKKAGIKVVNNVVDVTNYVMWEYGQPLHAFDYERLLKQHVIIRKGYTGEEIVTLDGVQRALLSDTLVIADDRDAIALAGIIGSKHSEIVDITRDVFLESASFDPGNNRKTAQGFGLRTEANIRFEKGLRPGLVNIALKRATRLINLVAGGMVAKGQIDEYPGREEPRKIRLTLLKIKHVLGIEISLSNIVKTLKGLGFQCFVTDNAVDVSIPYWRSDIMMEEDLVEEVARIMGYEAIPTTMLSSPIPHHKIQDFYTFRENIRDLLVREGLQEIVTYSACSLEALRRMRLIGDSGKLVRLANPMSSDFEYMRPVMGAHMLQTLISNLSFNRGPIAIFEMGRVYLKQENDLPEERDIVAGLLYGPYSEEGWLALDGEFDFYDAKGIVESLLGRLFLTGDYTALDEGFLHPGKSASINLFDRSVGKIGEIHPVVQKEFGVTEGTAVYFEMDVRSMFEMATETIPRIKALARFPSTIRAVSLLVDRKVTSVSIQSIFQRNKLITKAVLEDVYEGDGIPGQKCSLTFRVYLQSPIKTLSSDEANNVIDKVLGILKSETGAILRGTEGQD